ncbi:transporter substrate-binding domain-containing protein [Vibrio alfacsensis]|uniref:HD domain-containing phosphohydrolase n=1 Tax=Vibrio alfacsensis TaxID=1074311 RepID=UPI002ADDE85B|nr:HD domain-containing phosphohydrolase [Vibrio alfacsensis]WQE77144.1 transporter substrate-binding domain-containing protein [Vibrio alfacsensis]
MKKRTRISLRTVLGLMFVFCTLVTAGVAITLQYHFARKAELQHTLTRYQTIATGVSNHLSNLQNLAENVTRSGAQLVSVIGIDSAEKSIIIPLSKLLVREPSIHSIFVAKANNDFFQLINLSSNEIRSRVDAQPGDKWLLIVHRGVKQERRKVSIYYDENFVSRHTSEEFSNFIPTQRSWFENANYEDTYNTSPYLFNTLKVSGETFAIKVPESDTVVGVDVLLSSLEAQLTNRFVENKQAPEAEAFIYQANGRLIATNKMIDIEDRLPLVSPVNLTDEQRALVAQAAELKVSNQNSWGPIDYTVGGRPNGFSIDLFKMISEMTGLKFKFVNGRSWNELVTDFKNGNIDILQSIADQDDLSSIGVVGKPIYHAKFALLTKEENKHIHSLEQVKNSRIGLLKGWSIQDDLEEAYPEMTIINYASLHDAIDGVLNGDIVAVLDIRQILLNKVREVFRQNLVITLVNDSNLSNAFYYLASEEQKPLVEIINLAIDAITPEQRKELREKWFEGRTAESTYTFVPYEELLNFTKDPTFINSVRLESVHGVDKYVFVSKLTYKNERYFAVVIPEVYIMSGVNEVTLYAVGASLFVLALLIPVAWAMAKPISEPINSLRKQVRLVRDREYDKVQRVHSRIEEIHQLGLSVTRGSNALHQFEQRQNEFFESVIQLIARAIDEKSPYTAGHCNRVPEIALMLAEEAEKSNKGLFEAFAFENEEERREFRIAAWLHDCGKIATPEYVVDKGSKLETNYNRIHEVRMRFEVLWRDAQIQYLLEKLQDLGVQAQPGQDLQHELEALKEEFEFIAKANVGAEFMSEQDIERLHKLAEKEWTRYFDCGLGLSPLEETRYQPRPTPEREKLLTDRPDHIVEREHQFNLDPAFGINMTVPDKLYNHGELYNLSVQRGTLSAEERFKINEHMISGIKMLESIPFPPELERVPRYATTHHEAMEGFGYPRGLMGEELSIPERILAVADIFEALTAADRPYKKAKSLSEAISIMSKMALGGHIDKDVFKLLLTSGTYLSYAKRYLPDELIDDVDIDGYLEKLN